jgi:PHD/YefM family antitoxin component YafN of YafNO toxin-antitoxin module
MRTVSAGDFQKQTGLYQDMAQKEPITITKYDRPSLVLLAFEDYQKLTGNNKRALHVSELSAEALAALTTGQMDEKHRHLDALLED